MKHLLAAVSIQDTPLGIGGDKISTQYPTIGSVITFLYRNVFTVVGIVLVALLILGGIQYIMSAGSGDPKKTAQAQTIITDALIGFAVVFLAYFIMQVVEIVTGLTILNNTSL